MNYLINTAPVSNSDDGISKEAEKVISVKRNNNREVVRISRFEDKATESLKISSNLYRLYVKNNEYVYAKPSDIVVIESYDHLVKVYLAFGNTIKKTIRKNTLKDFLLLLPENQFMRIGRFCAINMQRLSGGNCKDQTFEFDFNFSVKLTHPISNTIFNNIGK